MTCRFCKLDNYDEPNRTFVKYGARHYAHHDCFLIEKGEAGLRELPSFLVGVFPYRLLIAHGLFDVAREIRTKAKVRS